jgi:hypothetical protein
MNDDLVTDADIVTRREAFAAGLKRYYTGKPCKRGHIAERCVYTCGCIACQRSDARRRYWAPQSGDRAARLAYAASRKAATA